jgi:hypothetical protein
MRMHTPPRSTSALVLSSLAFSFPPRPSLLPSLSLLALHNAEPRPRRREGGIHGVISAYIPPRAGTRRVAHHILAEDPCLPLDSRAHGTVTIIPPAAMGRGDDAGRLVRIAPDGRGLRVSEEHTLAWGGIFVHGASEYPQLEGQI